MKLAAHIRLRAYLRVDELLKTIEASKGGRPKIGIGADTRLMRKKVATTVGLSKRQKKNRGGGEPCVGRRGEQCVSAGDPPSEIPTLADACVDKHLANSARKLAAMPDRQFEAAFAEGGRPTVANIAGKPPGERSSAITNLEV